MPDDTQRPPPEPLTEHEETLRQRFSTLEKHELVELAVQLTTTYVLEGLGTIGQATSEASPARGADQVGDETFAGMLRRLKSQRPGDPVLERFIVNGEHIQVKTPMGNVDVTEYRRPTAPAAPAPSPAAPTPSVPTNRDSIYNRELYGQPPANARAAAANRPATPAAPASNPAPAANNPAPAQNRPPAPAPAPANGANANAKDPKDQKPAGDRFRMIELD